jgi:hypothetical protein
MKIISLPATGNFSPVVTLSSLAAALMTLLSLAGLLFSDLVYPSADVRQAFVSNDLVNLVIGLPVLLGSIWLARRGRLLGLLFWPGALLYVTYNSIAYTFAGRGSWMFLPYLTLAVLSAAVTVMLFRRMDARTIRERLDGGVPARLAGGVLAGFGVLFFVWRLILLIQHLTGRAALPETELATVVADLIICPLWVAGGVQLWRKQAWGYVSGVGLLFQASMLFVALLVYFLLQPLLAGVPFPVDDFIAVAGMSLVCFAPFGLFVRGILRGEEA